MSEIAVIGGEEFILGFQLTGIRNTKKIGQEPLKDIKELMSNPEIGIVIIDDKTMAKLDEHDRLDIESSVKPVFVEMSTEATQDNIRRLIKKSIGVDLMQE